MRLKVPHKRTLLYTAISLSLIPLSHQSNALFIFPILRIWRDCIMGSEDMGKFVNQVGRQHGASACRVLQGRSIRSHLMASATALVAAASFHPSAAQAQENVWEGEADQDWYKDENWSITVPIPNYGSQFAVIIDDDGPNSPVIEFYDDPWFADGSWPVRRTAASVSATIGSTGSGALA